MQTTRALLATSLAHPAGVDALPQVKSKKGRNFTYYSRTHIVTTHLLTYDYSPPQSVRVLHRVFFRRSEVRKEASETVSRANDELTRTYLPTNLLTYLLTYYLLTYYLPTYVRTHLLTYLLTYSLAY